MDRLPRQHASQGVEPVLIWIRPKRINMEQQFQDASNFNPAACAMLVVMVGLIWALPRRYAICPLLIIICVMPLGQRLVLFDLHFQFFRLVLLLGAVRVFIKGEMARLALNRTDKMFMWWAVLTVLLGTMAKPSSELFINRAGDAYNALGSYFFVRCVLVDFEDIVISVRALAWLSLPVAVLMVVEKTTGHNLLSVFGGVPEITMVREGHLRCQGAFRHPILAGCFGAAQIPLFMGLWFYRQEGRWLAVAAMASAIVIAVTASSSGALMAVLAAMVGLGLWRWRGYMRVLRWGTVLVILGLALVMQAPVWYLFAKLSAVTGGSGWHRAYLIDQTIAHFDEWWLFGTTYTAHWGPGGQVIAADPNMMDITNHYVMEAVKGGVVKLGLFLAIIIRSFGSVGRRLHAEEAQSPARFLVWALGVSLFVHCLSFLSIPYFDQSIVVWYWLLAAISGMDLVPGARNAPARLAEQGSEGPGSPAPGLETMARDSS